MGAWKGATVRSYKARNQKQAEKWIRNYLKQRRLHREIMRDAADIVNSKNFNRTKTHIQHGNMTVNNHCMNVAKYSLAISDKLEKLGISCKKDELVRGALLHDYFLYDWHDPEHVKLARLHGFRHPGIALNNAKREYRLTPREQDIIEKHMWPMTVVPPMCREAWIVTVADKWCSLLETVHVHKGHGIRRSRTEY
ncbi:MAG: HD domain-containing protein [Lachnospiraceae bacterium]